MIAASITTTTTHPRTTVAAAIMTIATGTLPGRAAAPRAPRLLVNDAGLSALERWEIHELNIAICEVYAAAYRAYIDAFVMCARAATSLDELRALGMPHPVELPRHEPGIDLDGDEALLWDFVERVDRPDDRRALCAMHSRSFALRVVLEG